MPMHFSRSLRRLEADTSRRSLLTVAVLLSLLILWLAWFVTAKVTVYATSSAARIEVTKDNHPVETPVAGRIVHAPLLAGQVVHAGDILLEIDARPEQLAQSQMRAKVAPSSRQIDALRDEIAAQQRALDEETQGAAASAAESAAKARESASAAEYAVDEARRLRALQARGIVSDIEAMRAAKLADQRKSEADTDAFAADRLIREGQARREDRLGRIARLNNEIAAADASRGEALAGAERLDYDIEQRVIRAPIGGRLAETSVLKIGSLVKAGDRLCTIVPDGVLKVVALFAPAASLGRVRAGQPARVRLEGFPWTQYGSVPAMVVQVAGEVRDGKVRVELSLPEQAGAVPLQHGLPAEVDVQVEQLSPLAMVLRSAGEKLRVNASSPSAAPDAR
ncbi:MAG: HlyD family efflux transporter periplasmic adaptor subunit [Vicinamibacterales bacterium]